MPITPGRAGGAPSASNQPHWSIGSAVLILVLSIAAIVFVPAVPALIYLAAATVYAQANNLTVPNIATDPNFILANLIGIFPAHLLTMWAAWRLVTRRGQQPFLQTLGGQWTKYFNFWTCLALTILMLALGGSIVYFIGAEENEFQRILASSYSARVAMALIATLTAPLVEEIVFRGVLYPAFERKYNASLAIFFVTAIFALIHVPQYLNWSKLASASSYSTISVILLLSLVLTLIRAGTKSLLPCFVIHALFNGIQSVLLIVEPFIVPKGEAPTVVPKPDLFFLQSLF